VNEHTVTIPLLLDVFAFVGFLGWGVVALVRRRKRAREHGGRT
jgi:hypothetical protein